MKQGQRSAGSTRGVVLVLCLSGLMMLPPFSAAQSSPYERAFAQSKAEVERTLKELQPSVSGRLPVLDGFTRPGDRPLDRFQRGYYQCAIQVNSVPAGGVLVRVSAKITAWYSDPASSKSGYQVLPSNGRLETDFLDRLEEALGGKASSSAANVPGAAGPSQPKDQPAVSKPSISAPLPSGGVRANSTAAKTSTTPAGSTFGFGNALSADRPSLATQKAVVDKHMEELTKEAKGLEEILRNQARPNNLVAVKKSGTPVLANPIEGAKVLFLAAAEDEYEILDMNANWVHVRISGLSRGWIRRSSLEVPGTSASDAAPRNESPASAEKFQVTDEQTATFPSNWEPLQGKTVKILTVQEISGSASDAGPRARLDFAKSLFEKQFAELTQSSTTAVGVALIFDSEDGGMTAATLSAFQQWKAGTLSAEAFWRRCFFDPPDAFGFRASK